MGLLGGKASVEVSVSPQRVAPGADLYVRVGLADVDRKARSGRVRLVHVDEYRCETNSGQHGTTVTTRKHTQVVAEQPLSAGGGAPADGSYDLTFTVAHGEPPTVGDIVAWEVQAALDRKGGHDVTGRAALAMDSDPGAYGEWADAAGTAPDGYRMEISADRRMVRPGERVSGRVVIAAERAIETRSLTACVHRLRSDQDGLKDHERHDKTALSEPLVLAAGVAQSFDFELAIPSDAWPSFRGEKNELHWYVEIEVDRRFRSNPSGELEIVVLTAED